MPVSRAVFAEVRSFRLFRTRYTIYADVEAFCKNFFFTICFFAALPSRSSSSSSLDPSDIRRCNDRRENLLFRVVFAPRTCSRVQDGCRCSVRVCSPVVFADHFSTTNIVSATAVVIVVVVVVVHFNNNNNNNIYIHIVTSRLYRRESYTLRSYVAAWNTLFFFIYNNNIIYLYLYSISSTLDRGPSYTNLNLSVQYYYDTYNFFLRGVFNNSD
ncbi:hypothetical protein AGLY_009470 [Aphis glycines]|uniref:Uncharacterized protein n=1 Tax=Aphis glycines TaxID=307491 RepID=A0A6G0THP6_APHGL|nr:hypothetical protein AGLY_009470 [Aphis glycines]